MKSMKNFASSQFNLSPALLLMEWVYYGAVYFYYLYDVGSITIGNVCSFITFDEPFY